MERREYQYQVSSNTSIMFKFRCMHCDKKIVVPTEFSGRHVTGDDAGGAPSACGVRSTVRANPAERAGHRRRRDDRRGHVVRRLLRAVRFLTARCRCALLAKNSDA
ncbi:MAG: hypothetical protein M3478_10220, partial [Planctomycetota bacterium]|nr:hypothetical protein [Planctomycetota bacterium]